MSPDWTQDGAEVSTNLSYSFTVTEAADYVANFELLTAVTQTTHFVEGWTWWSTFIEQYDATGLNQLETGLGANGQVIKTQNASLTYLGNGWYGNLEALDNTEAYRVKSAAAADVTLTGVPVATAEHPITLRPNWTWLGYPSVTPMSVEEALAGITPQEEDVLKTQNSMAVYLSGTWYGPLGTLMPGMGLMYLSNGSDDMTLTFPTLGKGGELRPNLTAENNHWQPNTAAYADNMTVIAVVELDGEELEVPELVPEPVEGREGPTQELGKTYELAVFAHGECRGSVQLLYVEPIQRHIAFLTVSGSEAAELRFGLYDMTTGEEYHNAEETLTYASNAVVGSLDVPLVVRFRGNTGLCDLDRLVQVFPNPVGKGQTFNVGLADGEIGEAQVDVINALGVVVETRRATSLQAPNVPGVYTLRITVEGQGTCYRKLIVR